MASNMSSIIMLRTWITFVCFVLSMAPIVSSFPKEMTALDSKFSSDVNHAVEETLEKKEKYSTMMVEGYDEITCENEGKYKCDEKNRYCEDKWYGGYVCQHCKTNFTEDVERSCVPATCENEGTAKCLEENRVCKDIANGGYECGSCRTLYIPNFSDMKCELVTCDNIGKLRCPIDNEGCKNLEGGGYECVFCDWKTKRLVDGECEPITCENEGTSRCAKEKKGCKNINGGGYKCESCDLNFWEDSRGKCIPDLCSNNRCRNNGICRMENDTFSCYCKSPFYGKTCENVYIFSTIVPTSFFSTTSTPEFTSNINFTSVTNQPEPSIRTTPEPWIRTTKESSNYTQYQTSERPQNFTAEYTKTSDFKDLKTGRDVTTQVETTLNPITASTSKPGAEFRFRNVYTVQNLTEIIIKT